MATINHLAEIAMEIGGVKVNIKDVEGTLHHKAN